MDIASKNFNELEKIFRIGFNNKCVGFTLDASEKILIIRYTIRLEERVFEARREVVLEKATLSNIFDIISQMKHTLLLDFRAYVEEVESDFDRTSSKIYRER